MKPPLARRIGNAMLVLAPRRLQQAVRVLRGAPPARPAVGLSYAPAYRGAAIHPMNQDWLPGAQSVDTEIREGLSLTRRRARDLRRNNPYAKQFLRLAGTNVVGPYGFTSRPQIRDAQGELDLGVNQALRRWFKDFSRSKVTLDRRLDLVRAELLALDTLLTDGECFVRLVIGAPNRHGLALQFIDADLVDERYNRPAGPREREIRQGVELDEYGAPVGYWVNQPHAEYGWPDGERVFVPAWNPETGTGEMLHLMLGVRLNQARGITVFHAAMELLNQLGAYGEAELFASRAGATTMGFIVPDKDATDPEGVDELGQDEEQPDLDGEPVSASRRGATRPEEIVVEPLAWNRLHPGESIETFKAEHPNAIVPEFTNLMLQGIASGIGGLHYEIANNLEGVNYTSSRAGQLTQQDIWRLLQELVIQDLHAPVYHTALRLALLRGAVELPGGRRARPVGPYAEVDHRGRGWTTMNTLQDSQNHALRISCGLRSRHQVMAEDNEDFDETLEELAEEQRKAAALGVVIAPPGSLAADVEAELAKEALRREDEERRQKDSKGKGASPKANSNGNGTDRSLDGSGGPPAVPARTPRPLAPRF